MVPSTKEVIPGASVNIVLKADQPTGRTVSGSVSTVLTRGNHPRGIKVRLSDGRVGRVQSMAGAGTVPAGSGSGSGSGPVPASGSTRQQESLPSQHIGLDAYITRPKRNGKKRNIRPDATDTDVNGGNEEVGGSVVCPVCGEFNGDEAAVAHHVAGHFD